jgi:hypothetical protein
MSYSKKAWEEIARNSAKNTTAQNVTGASTTSTPASSYVASGGASPVVEKSLTEIANKYNLDISDAAGEAYAENYAKPLINEINIAEQKALTTAQALRKALENKYFEDYRTNLYEAQSRGLTGGLAQLNNERLRIQTGQSNSDITKSMIDTQEEAALKRGSALAEAQVKSKDYLDALKAKVAQLQQADYQQRYQAYIDNENLLLKKQELDAEAARWQKEYELTLQQFEQEQIAREIQNAVYKKDYIDTVMPDIANNYISYMNKGDTSRAAEYIAKQASDLEKYGYTTQDLTNELSNIYQYYNANNLYNELSPYASQLKAQNWLSKLGAGASLGIGLAAAPFTGGGSLAMAALGAGGAILGTGSTLKTQSDYDKLLEQLQNAKNTRDNAVIPSWYLQYLNR